MVKVLRTSEPFPDPRRADPRGLVAAGGGLSSHRVLQAYRAGIFPWPVGGIDELWFCPDTRMVLPTTELRIARSLRKRARALLREGRIEIRFDTHFEAVIRACARMHEWIDGGTWITPRLQAAYIGLHELGYAHSVETWIDGRLVGGLYGVSVGNLFSGESMFRYVDDAGKLALVSLVEQLRAWEFPLVDCQQYTNNLARFGARDVPRAEFLDAVHRASTIPDRVGPWRFDRPPLAWADELTRT